MDTSMMVTPNVQGIANTMVSMDLGSKIGAAVLSKALDSTEQTGEAMVKMMEQSVNPYLGGNFDASV